MKTKKILISVILLLAIAATFSGCKKSDDKKPTCRIITATPVPGTDAIHFSYNSAGKLDRIVSASTIILFDYTGNTSTVTTLNGGTFSSKKIVTINAVGLATNVRVENNISGTNWSNTSFNYNG